jgi:hypothetical protein
MKQPSWKTPLILSVTLAILGTGAYWLEYKKRPQQEAADTAKRKPFSIEDETKVTALRIRGPLGEFKFKKNGARWEIVSPKAFPADDGNIKTLISSLSTLSSMETIDLKDDTQETRTALLKEYGLSPNERALASSQYIEIEQDGAKTTRLTFGQPHPIGDKYFTLTEENGVANDSRVLAIGKFFLAQIAKDLTYWRNKDLFTWDRFKVKKFKLSSKRGTFTAELKEGGWKLSPQGSSHTVDGDSDRVGNWLQMVANLKAKGFTGRAAVPAGTSPVLSINITFDGDKEPFKLSWLESKARKQNEEKLETRQNFVQATGLDEVVEVETASKSIIDKYMSDLRIPRLLPVTAKTKFNKVTLEGKVLGGPWIFSSDGKKWTSADSTLDASKMNDVIKEFSQSQIKEFKNTVSPGREKSITITFEGPLPGDRIQYKFWIHSNVLYAQNLAGKVTESLWLNDELKSLLPWSPEDWKVNPKK